MAYPTQPVDGAGSKFAANGMANNSGTNQFVPASAVNRRTQNGEVVADPTIDITTASGMGALLLSIFGSVTDVDVNWTTNASVMSRLRKISGLLEDEAGTYEFTTATQANVNVTATGLVAVAADTSTQYLLLYNSSDTMIWIHLGSVLAVGVGIPLAPGGAYEMSARSGNLWRGNVSARHGGTGNKTLCITRGS